MSKTGSAAKVKLNSFDDLFGTEQPQTGTEQVQEIALSELYEFKGHPFKVLDDERDRCWKDCFFIRTLLCNGS